MVSCEKIIGNFETLFKQETHVDKKGEINSHNSPKRRCQFPFWVNCFSLYLTF